MSMLETKINDIFFLLIIPTYILVGPQAPVIPATVETAAYPPLMDLGIQNYQLDSFNYVLR